MDYLHVQVDKPWYSYYFIECNSYTMACRPVSGENTQALVSGLS